MDTKRKLKAFPIGLYADLCGAGKSTVAQILAKHFSNVVLLSFATPIKNMTRAFLFDLGFPPEMIEHMLSPDGKAMEITDNATGKSFTSRHLMQTIGTEWGRTYVSPEIWVQMAQNKAVHALSQGLCPVFDDLRFDNEHKMLQGLNSFLIQIERPELKTRTNRGFLSLLGFGKKKHRSDGGLSAKPWDAQIINGSTPEELERSVLELIERSGFVEE